MAALNPYLNFNGNTEEAFNFYKSVFGGEFSAVMRFSDAPGMDNIPEHVKGKIMHISLPIGSNVLMGTDCMPELGHTATFGTNSYICIGPDSKADGERIFDALAAGGKVEMPFQKQFWGSYFGSLADKFGVLWMIDFADPGQN
jgi:PhnB protein